jgi:hypothetical protein
MLKSKPKNLMHRVITMLDRSELEYLDKLGKDALFSAGHKLSYNQILRALIDVAMETGVSGEGVRGFVGLKEEILRKMHKDFSQDMGTGTGDGSR